ncbi:MAG: phage virion morphogenesis protein [Proteobacteria bacterium]|nr:phage virion morphogenesis protein [Pseudomonadota bacterium]
MAGAGFEMSMTPLLRVVNSSIAHITTRRQLLAAEIGEALVSSTRDRFDDGVAPDGTPWEPTQRGGQILVDKGPLRNSIGYEASPAMVVWGSGLVYARPHQKGGQVGRGLAVTLPARTYLGISEDDQEEIEQIIQDFIAEGFSRGRS